MKFATITTKYPKQEDYYRNGFIHQRNLEYKKSGFECKVFIINDEALESTYIFEGIEVFEGDYNFIKESVASWCPDRILIHFINKKHMELLKEFNYSVPTIVWIHGVEALKWTRRLFNFTGIRFLKYIMVNTLKMRDMKKFVLSSKNVRFVFVSNWMKSVMEKDVGVKIKDYEIIPNVINTDLFKFKEKSFDKRKKILIIRNFDSRKYANDISIEAILKLTEKDYFEDLEFCIYGQGRYFDVLTKKLQGFGNVEIHNKFLSQIEIARTHKDYGVFLCPTRQDSQGVSMCEAMSSGLVPITSNNTAIPEFLSEEGGYLTDNNPESIVKAIEELYFNQEIFKEKSIKSSDLINRKCHQEAVITKELSFIQVKDN